MTDNPYTLTVVDACRLAGCSRATLWRWINAGRFPEPKKIGVGPNGRVRWCQADFDRYIKEQAE